MTLFKKLIFAVPFLLLLAWFYLQLNQFLSNPNFFLSLDASLLVPLLLLLLSLILTSFFFILFATLASDKKIVLPVVFLASLLPLVFLPAPSSFILAACFFVSLAGIFFLLQTTLSTYFTFKATSLLSPAIKQIVTLILLASTVAFYFSANTDIQTHGFKLPSSVIDTALKFIPQQELADTTQTQIPSISADQIKMLEQNPQLLKQYGLDPSILDTVKKAQENPKAALSPQQVIKPMIESQIQNFITPYQGYIPFILAILFFFTLQSMTSLLLISLPLLVGSTFLILEKMGFTRYETEMREVKKLVV